LGEGGFDFQQIFHAGLVEPFSKAG